MVPPPLALLTSTAVLALFITALLASTLRLLAILPKHVPPPKTRAVGSPTRLLVVLGSGGHTREMILMMEKLDMSRYTHRTYVVSSGDGFSAERAREFEDGVKEGRHEKDGSVSMSKGQRKQEKEPVTIGKGDIRKTSYDIAIVPRARRVHQSLLTTPFSALQCLWACFEILNHTSNASSPSKDGEENQVAARDYPDLILTNGPGTAVILILASMILRFFDIRGANSRGKMRTIYVESFARVTTLSLSGKLLVRVVNRFLVQWEQLEGVGDKGEYRGVLV